MKSLYVIVVITIGSRLTLAFAFPLQLLLPEFQKCRSHLPLTCRGLFQNDQYLIQNHPHTCHRHPNHILEILEFSLQSC